MDGVPSQGGDRGTWPRQPRPGLRAWALGLVRDRAPAEEAGEDEDGGARDRVHAREQARPDTAAGELRASPERNVNQVSVPVPTPTTSAAAVEPEPASAAVDAAEKAAAHEAIVSGFDAVAPSEVRNARRGEATSSRDSPPSRTRNALYSVRSPIAARTQRADDPEREPDGVDLEQRARARGAERGVERVDHGRPGADRDADDEAATQHRADAEQRDRADLRGDDEPEHEPRCEGCRHAGSLRSPTCDAGETDSNLQGRRIDVPSRGTRRTRRVGPTFRRTSSAQADAEIKR